MIKRKFDEWKKKEQEFKSLKTNIEESKRSEEKAKSSSEKINEILNVQSFLEDMKGVGCKTDEFSHRKYGEKELNLVSEDNIASDQKNKDKASIKS